MTVNMEIPRLKKLLKMESVSWIEVFRVSDSQMLLAD